VVVVKRAFIALSAAAIIIVLLSIVISAGWFTTPASAANREFYVGVEYAYGDKASELKALVDKVKDYTNLFVIGSVGISYNHSALTESCDYIANAKLHFIVMFTDITTYNYSTQDWLKNAKIKYDSLFLGMYRYDEPGGNQLDQAPYSQSKMVSAAANYSDAAEQYTTYMKWHVEYYKEHFNVNVFTADYGLYWYDYKAHYDTLLGEFVGNQSRPLHIALCRGAAQTQGKDWGVIVTWKYEQTPYLESGPELYNDLTLAYDAGAKYAVVFSYPQIGTYGTLTEEHFDALKRFWNNVQNKQDSISSEEAQVAYVLPKDYGYGFRSSQDTIWGLFNADELSPKVWTDVNRLESLYGAKFNVLYDDNLSYPDIKAFYDKVYFYNQTLP
jgi:hypothetical protein